jgi:hypothetical protein
MAIVLYSYGSQLNCSYSETSSLNSFIPAYQGTIVEYFDINYRTN